MFQEEQAGVEPRFHPHLFPRSYMNEENNDNGKDTVKDDDMGGERGEQDIELNAAPG